MLSDLSDILSSILQAKDTGYRGRYNDDLIQRGLPPLPKWNQHPYWRAHHRIPQYVRIHELPGWGEDYDFIDNPDNIRGVPDEVHKAINRRWAEFWKEHPKATPEEIEEQAKKIDQEFEDEYWDNQNHQGNNDGNNGNDGKQGGS